MTKETRDIRAETYHRSLSLDRAAVNTDARTVEASLSSEVEVERWFGKEVLSHEKGAVDLSRAADGLPLLWNHDSDKPIGLVEGVRLVGGKLRGTLRFSRNQRAEEVWRDVQDGMLRNISIGYQIHDWIESKDTDLVRVIRWTLAEASIAPVPADPTVGIGRSQSEFVPRVIAQAVAEAIQQGAFRAQSTPVTQEESSMTDTATVPETGTQSPAPPPVADIKAIRSDLQIAGKEAARAAVLAERERVGDIGAEFDRPTVPKTPEFRAIKARALSEGWSVEQTRKIILDAMDSEPAVDHRSITDTGIGIDHQAQAGQRMQAPATVVDDQLDKFKRGVSEALIVRAGIDQTRDAIASARAGGFVGVRLSRMAEQYLHIMGVDTRGWSDDQVAMKAMQMRASGATTSDFANLLSNTANKALLRGWMQAPETWQKWVRIGSVPDFKSVERVGISSFSALEKVLEDGEIKYGKLTDRKETVQAVSYAKKFRLTYQAIKNDDLAAFTAIPMAMGRAAQSIIGDTVYGLLDGTGPTLNQDGIALFDTSTHKNYVAAATAPTVDTLNTAHMAMRKQTDPNTGKALNVTARYLLAPVALDMTANVLMQSSYNPDAAPGSTSGKNTMSPNPWQGRFEVITDPRLDAQTNGTTAWYLAADANVFDTVEVVFVDGIAEPYLKEQEEWDTRGVEWVVGVDFGASVLDFRGLHKYKGNT